MSMTPRERVMCALAGEQPDRVPFAEGSVDQAVARALAGSHRDLTEREISDMLGRDVVVAVLFPPYFGMDSTSQGQVHGPVGFHPVWAPPGPEHVLDVFAEGGLIPEGGVEASALDIRVNKVGLVFEIAGLTLVMAIALFTTRTRRSREEEAEP